MIPIKPVFKNRDNPSHNVNGRIIWESRSVAVVAVLVAIFDNKPYVLLEKRSKKMEEPGKWCLPCGYLDWDENGWEAVIREVYEETSFYIPNYKIMNMNPKTPFFVNTEPTENRQNVALSYGLVFGFPQGLPQEPLTFKNEEIDEIQWVSVEDIEKYDIAFNHDKRIKMFLLL